MITAFPLTWPEGWKRTSSGFRRFGHFNKKEHRPDRSYATKRDLTVSDAVERIKDSLKRMGIDQQDLIISTNVRTRLDGLPRSGEKEPADPGAAVYWQSPGVPMRCMAIDGYTTVADNLAAIAATLEAMRAIERHGGAEILDRAFTGFKQLAAENDGPSWWTTLGVTAEAQPDEIQSAFRTKVREVHPDRADGGDRAAFDRLTQAREQGLAVAMQRRG